MAAAAFTVLIPARLRSTRLPRKVLADVCGKPLVVRVAERAAASGALQVVVAADDAEIVEAVEAHGVRALLTSVAHETGTDRLAEAAGRLQLADEALVVNVQGDEPLVDPRLVARVAETLAARREASIATAAHPLTDARAFFDPNVVKVVRDADGDALYFSRAPIPYARDAFAASRESLPDGLPALRHIGLYAYRVGFLRRYASLTPTPAERFEALEQLRAMGHGHRIAVALWESPMEPGVDTQDDLDRVRRRLAS